MYNSLNATYNSLKMEEKATMNEKDSIVNVAYIFIPAIAVITIIAHLAIRKKLKTT